MKDADKNLADTRIIGDVLVASFFSESSDRAREQKRHELKALVHDWKNGRASLETLERVTSLLRQGERPIFPFHWEIEFPEVFDRENSGFDAIVGNPPFMAGMRISSRFGLSYLAYLYESTPGAGSRADLVAYFFRRSFSLLRQGGSQGMLATNTIAQGDTRKAGLQNIVKAGGSIFAAIKRIQWPGLAAVVVSIVHIMKGQPQRRILDGSDAGYISSYLLTTHMEDEPHQLTANRGVAFSGVYPYGEGFLFDDNNENSTSIARMHEILVEDNRYEQFIRPFIRGSEFLTHPEQKHNRFVIDFGDMTEAEALRWPLLLEILEEKVRPVRMKVERKVYRERWWRFAESQPSLRSALVGKDRVLMHPFTSSNLAFAFVPSETLVGLPHIVIVDESFSTFGCLQSRVHEVWSRFTGSTLKDDLSYKVSDCFETFPFPTDWENNPTLEAAGKTYYEFRAGLMVRNDQGLTTTYNRFHDPDERNPDILKLRELHAAMDRAVLDVYGWTDLKPHCEFVLDYEEEDPLTLDISPTKGEGRQKKKPYRYRWPENIHDEVLARLLALNTHRAEEEQLAGSSRTQPQRTPRKSKARPSKTLQQF